MALRKSIETARWDEDLGSRDDNDPKSPRAKPMARRRWITCEPRMLASSRASTALSNLPHPLDLLADDLRLPDVPARVAAPRHEREPLLGDRLRLSERRRA